MVRQGQVQYPGRQVLAFTNIRPLVALGRLDEVDRALDEALRLPRDLRLSAALTGAMTCTSCAGTATPARRIRLAHGC